MAKSNGGALGRLESLLQTELHSVTITTECPPGVEWSEGYQYVLIGDGGRCPAMCRATGRTLREAVEALQQEAWSRKDGISLH